MKTFLIALILLSSPASTLAMEFSMRDIIRSTPLKKEAAATGAACFCLSVLGTYIQLQDRYICPDKAFRRVWASTLAGTGLYIFLSPEAQALRAQKKIKNVTLNPLVQDIKKAPIIEKGKEIQITVDWEKVLKTAIFSTHDTLTALSSDLKTSTNSLSKAQKYWFARRSTEFIERVKKLSAEADSNRKIIEAAVTHLGKSPQWKQEVDKL